MTALLLACPMCFGDPNSSQVQAAKLGVLVLLAVVTSLLVAIALIARSWAKRAKSLDQASQPTA